MCQTVDEALALISALNKARKLSDFTGLAFERRVINRLVNELNNNRF